MAHSTSCDAPTLDETPMPSLTGPLGHHGSAFVSNNGGRIPKYPTTWTREADKQLVPSPAELSHHYFFGPYERHRGLMALLWACALLLCQLRAVVGQSYPSCSVSRNPGMVSEWFTPNLHCRRAVFQPLYLRHATARIPFVYANKSIRQAY